MRTVSPVVVVLCLSMAAGASEAGQRAVDDVALAEAAWGDDGLAFGRATWTPGGTGITPGVPPESLAKIRFNDNRVPAGRLVDGVLTLQLEVQEGVWHLLGDDRPGGTVLAFAEEGQPPEIPGPLVRVPLGTELRVSVHNPTDSTLVVHGLSTRRVATMDSLVVPAGATREARFAADAEGTYHYWGTTTGASFEDRFYEDSQLAGAFIVDPPGTAPADDRVFVMTLWYGGQDEEGEPDWGKEFLAINGRPWPLTERLRYELDDSVRWRIINATIAPHPMHLHGFFYRVDARGDISRDSIYWPAQRRMVVTELMRPGTTMSMVWSPDRPGGWIFHCHLSWHVVANAPLGPDAWSGEERDEHLLRGHHDDPNNHVVNGMGGLMLGIYVRPPPGWVPNEPKRRPLRLFIQSDSAPGDPSPRFGYVLQRDDREPALDSLEIPGTPLVLWKGEPTSVMVINRSSEASQVHWHGLEIESYFDGVAGVGGYPDRLTPAILPGDSFEMRITPPRAGSYMYHTHVNDIRQQAGGLYGPFIVLDEAEAWDPDTDRIFLISNSSDYEVLLNGTRGPDPAELEVGVSYRFRLMNITLGNPGLVVRLTRDDTTERWRPVAKDGWDLPAHQAVAGSAEQPVSIGDTFDVEYVPRAAGELRLEVHSGGGRLFVSQLLRVVE